ncbi:MAG: regulatory protein RecX [Planctomycetota bacterium]|nr:regulatory protein RecX [Planctomycetota bacterium]
MPAKKTPAEPLPIGEEITTIRPLPSDPSMRSVRVGRRVIARLRASDVESIGLRAGEILTDELAGAIEAVLAVNNARKDALRLLGRRGYSSGQLVDRLKRKGHDESASRAVVDELLADNWLDDEEFARAVAREIRARGPASTRLIIQKLRQRRIEGDLARRVAEEALADVDPVEEAIALAETRLRTMGRVPPATAARRLSGALARRGFDMDTIRTALERVKIADDEPPEALPESPPEAPPNAPADADPDTIS